MVQGETAEAGVFPEGFFAGRHFAGESKTALRPEDRSAASLVGIFSLGKTDLVDRRGGIDIHPTATVVKANFAVHEGEDGVVAAETDVLAGQELGAALADDDVAGDDGLAAEFLHAEAFAGAIAPVLDGSLTFLMSHNWKWVCGG